MFPIPFNFPFRKNNGDITTIGDAISEGGGEPYVLPTASADVKGGVKIGDGLTMDGETLKTTGSSGGGFTLLKHVLSTDTDKDVVIPEGTKLLCIMAVRGDFISHHICDIVDFDLFTRCAEYNDYDGYAFGGFVYVVNSGSGMINDNSNPLGAGVKYDATTRKLTPQYFYVGSSKINNWEFYIYAE